MVGDMNWDSLCLLTVGGRIWDLHNLEHKSQHEKWASGSPRALGATATEVEGARGESRDSPESLSHRQRLSALRFLQGLLL